MHFKHEDKVQHFISGAILSFVGYIFFYAYLDISYLHTVLIVSGSVTIVAIGIELFSLWTGHGYYELHDILATVLGIPVGIVCAGLLEYSI